MDIANLEFNPKAFISAALVDLTNLPPSSNTSAVHTLNHYLNATKPTNPMMLIEILTSLLSHDRNLHFIFSSLKHNILTADALGILTHIVEFPTTATKTTTKNNGNELEKNYHSPKIVAKAITIAKSLSRFTVKHYLKNISSKFNDAGLSNNRNFIMVNSLRMLSALAKASSTFAREIIANVDLGSLRFTKIVGSDSGGARFGVSWAYVGLFGALLNCGDGEVVRAVGLNGGLRTGLIACLEFLTLVGKSGVDGYGNAEDAEDNVCEGLAFLKGMEMGLGEESAHVVKSAFGGEVLKALAMYMVAIEILREERGEKVLSQENQVWEAAEALWTTVVLEGGKVRPDDVVRVLNSMSWQEDEYTLQFILSCVSKRNEIAIAFLSRSLLTAPVNLSSSYLATCALIVHCIPRLKSPLRLVEKSGFFERTLIAPWKIIRRYSMLALRSYIKTEGVIPSHVCSPQKVAKALCLDDRNEDLYEIMAMYVRKCPDDLWQPVRIDAVAIAIKASLTSSNEDLSSGKKNSAMLDNKSGAKTDSRKLYMAKLTIPVILAALTEFPTETVRAVLSHRGFLSSLLFEDKENKLNHFETDKGNELLRKLLFAMRLVPDGMEYEVDIWLMTMLRHGNYDVLYELEDVVLKKAWLKLEAQWDYCKGCVSLLTSACVKQLLWYCKKQQEDKMNDTMTTAYKLLTNGVAVVAHTSTEKERVLHFVRSVLEPLDPEHPLLLEKSLVSLVENLPERLGHDGIRAVLALRHSKVNDKSKHENPVASFVAELASEDAVKAVLRCDGGRPSFSPPEAEIVMLLRAVDLTYGEALEKHVNPVIERVSNDVTKRQAKIKDLQGLAALTRIPKIPQDIRLVAVQSAASCIIEGNEDFETATLLWDIVESNVRHLPQQTLTSTDMTRVLVNLLQKELHGGSKIGVSGSWGLLGLLLSEHCVEVSTWYSLHLLHILKTIALDSSFVTTIAPVLYDMTQLIPPFSGVLESQLAKIDNWDVDVLPVFECILRKSKSKEETAAILFSKLLTKGASPKCKISPSEAKHERVCVSILQECISLLPVKKVQSGFHKFAKDISTTAEKAAMLDDGFHPLFWWVLSALVNAEYRGSPVLSAFDRFTVADLCFHSMQLWTAMEETKRVGGCGTQESCLAEGYLDSVDKLLKSVTNQVVVQAQSSINFGSQSAEVVLRKFAISVANVMALGGDNLAFTSLTILSTLLSLSGTVSKFVMESVVEVATEKTDMFSACENRKNERERDEQLDIAFTSFLSAYAKQVHFFRRGGDDYANLSEKHLLSRLVGIAQSSMYSFSVTSSDATMRDLFTTLEKSRICTNPRLSMNDIDTNRIEATKMYVLASNIGGTSVCCLPYEPHMLLRSIRMEAVSDALHVTSCARNGLLGTVLHGLASTNLNLRGAAYATLAAILRMAQGHEQAYEMRPILLFLQLLRNSIESPLQLVNSLFAASMSAILEILVQPSHALYKKIIRFLLRDFRLDVDDCALLSILGTLEEGDTPEEMKAGQLLLMDVVVIGLQTWDDHIIMRRRGAYLWLMRWLRRDHRFLGIMTKILARVDGRVASDLVGRFALLPWMYSLSFAKNLSAISRMVRATVYHVPRKHFASLVLIVQKMIECISNPQELCEVGQTALALAETYEKKNIPGKQDIDRRLWVVDAGKLFKVYMQASLKDQDALKNHLCVILSYGCGVSTRIRDELLCLVMEWTVSNGLEKHLADAGQEWIAKSLKKLLEADHNRLKALLAAAALSSTLRTGGLEAALSLIAADPSNKEDCKNAPNLTTDTGDSAEMQLAQALLIGSGPMVEMATRIGDKRKAVFLN